MKEDMMGDLNAYEVTLDWVVPYRQKSTYVAASPEAAEKLARAGLRDDAKIVSTFTTRVRDRKRVKMRDHYTVTTIEEVMAFDDRDAVNQAVANHKAPVLEITAKKGSVIIEWDEVEEPDIEDVEGV